jgi:hypothetical protein
VRELAASGLQFAAAVRERAGPAFGRSAAVVPWDARGGEVGPGGGVVHLDVSEAAPNWCYVVGQALKEQAEL